MTVRPGWPTFGPIPVNDPQEQARWLRQAIRDVNKVLDTPQYAEFWEEHNKEQVRADMTSVLRCLVRLAFPLWAYQLGREDRVKGTGHHRTHGDSEAQEWPADDIRSKYPWIDLEAAGYE